MSRKGVPDNKIEAKLSNSLLLNKYMLSLLGLSSLDEITSEMKHPSLEGTDDNNVSNFYNFLDNELRKNISISREKLKQYDENIVRHTESINFLRPDKVSWKYFQYLYLLFVEIYLDRYFSDRNKLLVEINNFRANVFNANPHNYTIPFSNPLELSDLNKIACWCATGAGKTLMMHVNVLQIRHYAEHNGVRFNKTLLITPKEALSRQHLDELKLSNLPAVNFDKNRESAYDEVVTLEITKLADFNGDKTVSVDSFEKNNLVLVDEGHRGTGGDSWKKYRDKLSVEGFCIEYSATFSQAIAAESNKTKKNAFLREYGSSTIFDYSYRYFYNDGYGKDFVTRNMNGSFDADQELIYLVGGLLGFYQQIIAYEDNKDEIVNFMIEKPIAIFVGNTVGAGKANNENSDVVKLVQFFSKFVSEKEIMVSAIHNLLNGTDGLIDGNGRPIYDSAFTYLKSIGLSADSIYNNMLYSIFNQRTSGVKLHLDNLKGVEGEIGLRMGEAEYFGVINVGDPKSVLDKSGEFAIIGRNNFNQRSLFDNINKSDSGINVLIGAKKFTEGWSSWRVSTMCLLNVGSGDGSEIIQLFGRGVRLKGYRFSLKRSGRLDKEFCTENIPAGINILETLNIFGIKANYMKEFSRAIKDEGVEDCINDKDSITLPLMPNIEDIDKKRLKYLRVQKGKSFIKDVPLLQLKLDVDIYAHPVVLDRYVQIDTFRSSDVETSGLSIDRNIVNLSDNGHLALVDWDEVYFAILRYKNERRWFNLLIKKAVLQELAYSNNWYILYMPEADLEFDNIETSVRKLQEILISLLKLYIDKFYNREKSKWISHNLEVVTLSNNDTAINEDVHIRMKHDLFLQLQDTLLKLKHQLQNKTFAETIRITTGFEALYYNRHLYSPLMYYKCDDSDDRNLIDITPVALNKNERRFIMDLITYTKTNPAILKSCELYILRNKSKSGIRFFVDSGFYPDFILWIVKENHQYVTFIDPHGLVHARSFIDDKVTLFKTLKQDIQNELGDADLTLDSYILSPTRSGNVMHWVKGNNKSATYEEILNMFHDNHIYFMYEDKSYINKIITSILS